MYTSKVLLLLFIFLAVWLGSVNVVRLIRGANIAPMNFILMAIGIVGVIAYYI